ncbi:hypothetical protein [Helicobacter bilis]|nr:hypothetical protein [Helicobacter bilis]MDD7296621.1 hypothetical protein [Helicobacter bilis]MDY4401024.1 hypothetical protein [Helicobacter bilis]
MKEVAKRFNIKDLCDSFCQSQDDKENLSNYDEDNRGILTQ